MLHKRIELKVACIENEMTQQELAQKLGLTNTYVSDVIRGTSNLSYIKQVEAARILGRPRAILFK